MPTQIAYKNIIFDFDGTLADTFDTAIRIINKEPSKFGIDGIDESEIPRLKNMSIKYLLREFNVNILRVPMFVKMLQEALYSEADSIKAFPHIEELIVDLKLKGGNLGIITSNSKKMVEKFLENEDIHVFDYIRSEKALFGKHQSITRIMKKYKFNPAETIYVGDEVRDINATKKVGIPIVSVTWGYNDEKILKLHEPEFMAHSVDELRNILFTSD